MPSRDAGQIVLWPHYFDKNLSRADGRRVPADLAVEDPSAGAIAQAARTLGLKVELLEKAKAPRHGYDKAGCVLVAKSKDSKETVLKQVARRL